jgi:hypothetical protein
MRVLFLLVLVGLVIRPVSVRYPAATAEVRVMALVLLLNRAGVHVRGGCKRSVAVKARRVLPKFSDSSEGFGDGVPYLHSEQRKGSLLRWWQWK